MKYSHYIKESDQYMHSLFMCMDNAWAAEKMYDWENIGDANDAWVKGPYISAGANCPQIDKSHPYCLRVSPSSSKLMGYQIGPNPIFGKNGGVAIGHDSEMIKANVIIPTVAICMQFALLESVDVDMFSLWAKENNVDLSAGLAKRYDRRPAKSRMETLNSLCSTKVSDQCVNAYESVSNFRNKLIHEPQFFCGSPDCAVDVYVVCQAISYNIHQVLYGDCEDAFILHRKSMWMERINAFDEAIEFA